MAPQPRRMQSGLRLVDGCSCRWQPPRSLPAAAPEN
nr:MAG TPA: hypothetical protein [Caudoviricetes sp.]